MNKRCLITIFSIEVCELFARFSILATLIFYLTNELEFSDQKAFLLLGSFGMFLFISPVLGGIIIKNFLSNRNGLVLGILLMGIGSGILLFGGSNIWLYLALALFACGNGFFMPSIMALVSCLTSADNAKGQQINFSAYYMGKNLSAILGALVAAYVIDIFNYEINFMVNTIFIFLGLIIFISGRKSLAKIDLSKNKYVGSKNIFKNLILIGSSFTLLFLLVFFTISLNLNNVIIIITVSSLLIYLAQVVYTRREMRKNIILLLTLLIFVVIFVMFLYQGVSTINLFIERIINRQLGDNIIPPAVFFALNPIFMLILGPLIVWILTKYQIRFKEGKFLAIKIFLGFLLLAFGFAIFAVAAFQAMSHGQASLFYVVFSYLIIPIGEILFFPTIISLIPRLVSLNARPLYISFYLLAWGVGIYLMGRVANFVQIDFPIESLAQQQMAAESYCHFFIGITILLVFTAFIAFLVLRKITSNMKLQ